MRGSTPVLVVLLAASILANVLLIARRAAAPEPSAVAPIRPPGGLTSQESVTSLKASLEAERKKSEELRARIERLETDKKVLVQEAPGAARTDKLAAFRDKLRKLMKVMKDPAAKAGAVDPDSMVELTETMMEFFKLSATRAKDPKTYAEYLHAFYEVALEGDVNALTPAQSSALSKLLEDFGGSLSKVPASPAGERLLKEIELEAGLMGRVHDLLSAPQRELLTKSEMNALASGNMLSMSYISKEGAADQIATMWSQLYGLEGSQQPQAKLAAQAYLDALNRAGGKSYAFDNSGSAESYEARLRSVREQLAALNMLSASMTPAQQERLRTQTLREFVILEGKMTPEATVPTEK
jgi:hypothetical protein